MIYSALELKSLLSALRVAAPWNNWESEQEIVASKYLQ